MYRRRYHVVGPMVLIALGAIFLLSNAGVLPIGAWDLLLRLWPLVLVAWGLEGLIGRGSALGALLVIALTLGLGAGVVWYSVVTGAIHTSPLATRAISQPLGGASEAEVTIEMSIGALDVGGLIDSPLLIEGTVTEGGGLTAQPTVRTTGGILHYTLKSEGFALLPGGPEWRLKLNGRVPIRLIVDHGVGGTKVDLSRLNIREAIIDTSIGDTIIVAPDQGRPRISVDHSIGTLLISVPQFVQARISIDTGIGAVDIGPRFHSVDKDIYETERYEGADRRVEIIVDHSIGELIVR